VLQMSAAKAAMFRTACASVANTGSMLRIQAWQHQLPLAKMCGCKGGVRKLSQLPRVLTRPSRVLVEFKNDWLTFSTDT
jgi:hypothetical protein